MTTQKKPILVVAGPSYYNAVSTLGPRETNLLAFIRDPDAFQFVLFTGGEDIGPDLYGDKSPNGLCHYNEDRDFMEKSVFNVAIKNGVKMVGICRGLQFLTAMAGGKLVHHLNNHAGSGGHPMYLSRPWEESDMIMVNSYHHQMCMPPEGSHVLGVAPKGLAKGVYYGDEDKKFNWDGADVEAMYLPNIHAFGVQWHPEMLAEESEGYKWFNKATEMFIADEQSFIGAFSSGVYQKPLYKVVGS